MMTIIEKEQYIRGNQHTGEVVSPFRASMEDYNVWEELLYSSTGAPRLLQVTESSSQFFQLEPDIAQYVPKKSRDEMFYALKNGFFSPCVPAKCLYLVNKIYNTHRLCNLVPKLLPKEVFAKNYLAGGFTLLDVIATLCDKRYTPLARHMLSSSYGDHHEVYVNATDMIAAIPADIASKLSEEEIFQMEVDNDGLKIKGVYIAFMGGRHGACNSKYDLRKLV
jgi:hypothetical protein